MILTTTEIIAQTCSLDNEDFSAMKNVLKELDGVSFFNCGLQSGASQPHKHIQFISREGLGDVPIDRLLVKTITNEENIESSVAEGNGIAFYSVPLFKFKHALCDTKDKTAEEISIIYQSMMKHLGLMMNSGEVNYMLPHHHEETEVFQSYNVLLSREYLLIVPRVAEKYKNVSVNSLGYIGCILTKGDEQFNVITNEGPLAVLQAVSAPK